ncbi:pectinesterase 11 [Tasmannia lanceolata]|uniref:pectinesterase 11 n=1 Tax=Tasmannia lanceolata TaxID=3420 RepID=UPI004062CBF4
MAASSSSSSVDSLPFLIRVDQSGNGDYKKIQEAIDSIPSNNNNSFFIWIKPGIYSEKLVVPADKPFITLSGTKPNSAIITWSNSGEIYQTATLSVLGSNFVGRFLTIQNTHGAGAKAVALQVSGDKAAFYGCRILSYQDTLLDDIGRHYYHSCYIEGATDFIFGNSISLFDKCHLNSLSPQDGAITAQGRISPTENTAFSFVDCKITGVGHALLGRPWKDYSRVVFARTYMSNVILPQGWDDWNDPARQRTVFYGQYRCYGPGANLSGRVGWSHELSSEEAAPFMTKTMIDGLDWLRPTPSRFRRTSATIVENLDGV